MYHEPDLRQFACRLLLEPEFCYAKRGTILYLFGDVDVHTHCTFAIKRSRARSMPSSVVTNKFAVLAYIPQITATTRLGRRGKCFCMTKASKHDLTIPEPTRAGNGVRIFQD